MRRTCLLAGVAAALMMAAPACGQFVQYAPPGDFVSPAESRAETFKRAMERSRWRFGRLLVDPWIYLRDFAYQDNQTSSAEDQSVTDLTVGIGAGINTYMTIGGDFIWGTFLLPEYTWWQDLDERRRLNGRYGTGLFENVGRIGVEATLTRFDESAIFSDEVEQQVSQRTDSGELSLTYNLGRGFLLFADFAARSFSSLEDDPALAALSRLDRDETIYRVGVGFESLRGVKLSLGFEQSDVEFESAGLDRSNSGDAIVFDFLYDGPLFLLNGQLASRSVDPEMSSEFIPYDDITGSLNLGSRPIGPARLELYARQDVSYSIQSRVSYVEYETAGAGIRVSLGSRGELHVYGEEGDDEYLQLEPGDLPRTDDRTSYGLSFSLRFDRYSFSIGYTVDDYESTIPVFDRDFTRFRTSVSVGGARTSPWG